MESTHWANIDETDYIDIDTMGDLESARQKIEKEDAELCFGNTKLGIENYGRTKQGYFRSLWMNCFPSQ